MEYNEDHTRRKSRRITEVSNNMHLTISRAIHCRSKFFHIPRITHIKSLKTHSFMFTVMPTQCKLWFALLCYIICPSFLCSGYNITIQRDVFYKYTSRLLGVSIQTKMYLMFDLSDNRVNTDYIFLVITNCQLTKIWDM